MDFSELCDINDFVNVKGLLQFLNGLKDDMFDVQLRDNSNIRQGSALNLKQQTILKLPSTSSIDFEENQIREQFYCKDYLIWCATELSRAIQSTS